MAKQQARKRQVRQKPQPKAAQKAVSRRSSKAQPAPKAAPARAKKAAAKVESGPSGPDISQLASLLLQALGGKAPAQAIEEPPIQLTPLDLVAAEAALYPPETEFGSEPDASAMFSFAPGNSNWKSDNNDERVTWENIQSFKARTEATFEVLKNKMNQIEAMVGHVVAMLQSKGR